MSIYLDNAATTPVEPRVLEAMLPFFKNEFGNPSAIHGKGRPVRAAIEKSRRTIAGLLNVSPSEIFFTSCGTEANNTALLGSVRDLGVERIISSKIEHHCVLHTLENIEKHFGVELILLDVDEVGRIDYSELENLIIDQEKKTLVSLMHANNEIGTMIDIDKVAKLCQENNTFLHSDTVQTFGHFTLDLQKTPLSFMVSSAHKYHGPKGIGFLYINGDLKISPLIFGGSQERNMRAGTENVTGIIGLGKAAEIAYEELEKDKNYIKGLKTYLIEQLKSNFVGLEFNGDVEGDSLYTVVNVSFPPSPKSGLLLLNLDISGICASGGSACSSGVDVGSHVLSAMGVDKSRANIRFSFSKYNTKEEVDILIKKLQEILLN